MHAVTNLYHHKPSPPPPSPPLLCPPRLAVVCSRHTTIRPLLHTCTHQHTNRERTRAQERHRDTETESIVRRIQRKGREGMQGARPWCHILRLGMALLTKCCLLVSLCVVTFVLLVYTHMPRCTREAEGARWASPDGHRGRQMGIARATTLIIRAARGLLVSSESHA
jgi:hypothetical protein